MALWPHYPALRSGQVLTIGGDDLFVPVKAILFLPAQVAGAIIKLVDIDEAVTLGHLAGRCAGWDKGGPGVRSG